MLLLKAVHGGIGVGIVFGWCFINLAIFSWSTNYLEFFYKPNKRGVILRTVGG